MNLIDQLKSFSTSTVIVTACAIREDALEVYVKSYEQDSVYADEELSVADDEIAFLLENTGWTRADENLWTR